MAQNLEFQLLFQLCLALDAIVARQPGDQFQAHPFVENPADVFARDPGHGGARVRDPRGRREYVGSGRLRDGLGLLRKAAESEKLARSVPTINLLWKVARALDAAVAAAKRVEPADPALKAAQVAYIAGDCEVKVLIADTDKLDSLDARLTQAVAVNDPGAGGAAEGEPGGDVGALLR